MDGEKERIGVREGSRSEGVGGVLELDGVWRVEGVFGVWLRE